MKRKALLIILLTFTFWSNAYSKEYHIGLITGEEQHSKDSYFGVLSLKRKLQNTGKKGIIKHIVVSNEDMKNSKKYQEKIIKLSEDPLMKGIFVVNAANGTLEAFKKIKEINPNILLVVNNSHECLEELSKVSDLVLNRDNTARGYLLVKAAQEMGAKNFIHLSFPRHMKNKVLNKRKKIMEEVAKDLNLNFINLEVPDPMDKGGEKEAKRIIYESVPKWLKKYGENTAFFITDIVETEPLIKGISENGGYFIEADLPSSVLEYPKALGIEVNKKKKYNVLVKDIEDKVLEKNEPYKIGTLVFSYNYIVSLAIGNYLIDLIDKKSEPIDFKEVVFALEKETEEVGWNGLKSVNRKGEEIVNSFSLYQDIYVYGHGYLYVTDLEIPKKYLEIK